MRRLRHPPAQTTCRTPASAGKPALVPLSVRLARGRRPRGCRAPARRVLGRRVRYVIGSEAGQVDGMRWRRAPRIARDR
ncbi:tryptophan biosynthesis modulator TrpM [Lentzea sp. NPDC060358]|uniref:tryptophan biosynthesis modulator TrpM n=1 Tax=Lentzea sp. NPDC060358 TaxID=3347103 RepID=UPI00365F7499